MDKKEFDERVLRLLDISDAIGKLPPEIRSDAFGLLKGYVLGRTPPEAEAEGLDDDSGGASGNDNGLFGRFDHDKPSDNVKLIAADLFQRHGAEPFSLDDVKTAAANAGITIPARVDMTLRQAKENGKSLFVGAGIGKFKLTVHGESHLRSFYGVKKGVMKKQEADK